MTETVHDCKPELLAPAGRLETVHAVVDAGADAVYLSGKQFNMRRHRRDFHFSESDLEAALAYCRERGKRLYVTVNALIAESETADLGNYLQRLARLGVDALIVQDLAVVRLAARLDLSLPLHASTMMNVSGVHSALALKKRGFSRD